MINRRKFIKSSATMAAGTVIAPSILAACDRGSSEIDKVGLQLWSIAKTLEKDFTGGLDLLSQIGYKELELFGPYPFSTEKDKVTWKNIIPLVGFAQSGYFGHTAKELKQLLDDRDLTTPSMHIGLDTLRNKMGETAEAAHVLGQQYAGIASIPEAERSDLDGYKRMADDFNEIGAKAKANGIRFMYHNHGYGLQEIDGIIPLNLILERTDPELVFFEMDIFWTIAGGADPVKYLDANPGRYKLMHVKDMTKRVRFSGDGGNPKQWVELFPYITDAGSGVLDFKTILSHARKSGVDHFILENDAITDPKRSLEDGYKFLSTLKLTQ
ncbi:sugar phosphate isomerase/epimerase [Flavobacteriaceae bacterium F89]|uniref:Sugar phosphate isomerase/epimerase n=1 Tax=Cerina litoralis TaxID=2874477 RepID=A0AAE3JPJ8_9FLAO|nr:sugar phosphate isomerase/epimerase [Cerina litoralis]MCG2462195.1 sugar phosphate isomerase/epimerase [Cerina litoralis]